MPFVNIRLIDKALGDDPAAKKADIGQRVTQAICEVSGLPPEAVWIVFENVEPDHWQVGGKTVSALWKERPGPTAVASPPRATSGSLVPAATIHATRARRRTRVTRTRGRNGPSATPNHSISLSARSRQLVIT